MVNEVKLKIHGKKQKYLFMYKVRSFAAFSTARNA
jgi:hypothetical protein